MKELFFVLIILFVFLFVKHLYAEFGWLIEKHEKTSKGRRDILFILTFILCIFCYDIISDPSQSSTIKAYVSMFVMVTDVFILFYSFSSHFENKVKGFYQSNDVSNNADEESGDVLLSTCTNEEKEALCNELRNTGNINIEPEFLDTIEIVKDDSFEKPVWKDFEQVKSKKCRKGSLITLLDKYYNNIFSLGNESYRSRHILLNKLLQENFSCDYTNSGEVIPMSISYTGFRNWQKVYQKSNCGKLSNLNKYRC